jgi:hypothetical protein
MEKLVCYIRAGFDTGLGLHGVTPLLKLVPFLVLNPGQPIH